MTSDEHFCQLSDHRDSRYRMTEFNSVVLFWWHLLRLGLNAFQLSERPFVYMHYLNGKRSICRRFCELFSSRGPKACDCSAIRTLQAGRVACPRTINWSRNCHQQRKFLKHETMILIFSVGYFSWFVKWIVKALYESSNFVAIWGIRRSRLSWSDLMYEAICFLCNFLSELFILTPKWMNLFT